MVKRDVCQEVLKFLNTGILDERLNETEIILLTKLKDDQLVEEFRPISLCNVTMKIITKVLANRLKVCLHEVISESQSAFVKGRRISDNIFVAHKVTHYLRHMQNRQAGFLSIKVDMNKAFDRVEWGFQ